MTVLSADDYAAITSMDLHALDLTHPRTRQALSGQVGISDLGKCQEQTRLLIGQQQPTDSPSTWAAQVGTALHDKWAAARAAGNPRLMHNVKVELTLPNGLVVPGTADEVDPDEPSVTDAKTKNGLAVVRRQGADRQQRWQRHGYYGALVQAGILPAEGIVRNVFLDRSGRDDRPHVEQEPYDPSVLDEMSAWLDEVIDAHKAGHEALKEKPRTFCMRYCQFYSMCRLPEVDAPLLFDAALAEKVDDYYAADRDEKEARQRKEELREFVEGVTGFTSTARIQSTWVNKGSGGWRVEVSAP